VDKRPTVSRNVALRWLGASLALVWVLSAAAGCNQNLGQYATSPGNTPNRPPQSAFRVLGQVGLPFNAIIFDSRASWQIQGAVPFNVVVVNGTLPVKMIATKLAAGNGIMSLQLTVGFSVTDFSSTADPFGTASLQTGAKAPGFSPPPPAASPDVRYYVNGPRGERFSGLIEDDRRGYTISDQAPTVYLFENPSGKTDGQFNQIQDLGPLDIDIVVNGVLVASAKGGPSVSIRQP
jgi:hypothetical protein